jgi:hypothetical protein
MTLPLQCNLEFAELADLSTSYQVLAPAPGAGKRIRVYQVVMDTRLIASQTGILSVRFGDAGVVIRANFSEAAGVNQNRIELLPGGPFYIYVPVDEAVQALTSIDPSADSVIVQAFYTIDNK